MWTVEAELRTEGAENGGHRLQRVRDTVRQRRGSPESRQVHGDDIALGGQDPQHGVPRLMVVSDAVEQQQRFAGTDPFVRHGDRAWAVGRFDGERDRGGHVAAP